MFEKQIRIIGIVMAVVMTQIGTAYAETNYERIRREGVVKIGSSNEAPFAFTLPDGSIVGEDYELAKLVFERLGIRKIEPVITDFGSLIPGLKARRFDIVAAALYVRPARCAQVVFSEPNLTLSDAVIVAAGNPKKIHSYGDIARDKSIKVTVTVGSAHQKNAQANGVTPDQMVETPSITNSLATLRAGRSDGMLQNTIYARWLVKSSSDPAITVAQPFETPMLNGKPLQDYAAFAFNPDDTDLRDAFNVELAKILNTPPHAEILARYGLTSADVPKNVKTAALCAP